MKTTHIKALVFIAMTIIAGSCQDDVPMVNLGIDDIYNVYRMRTLRLHPEYSGTSYRWTMPDSNGQDSVVCTDRDLYFCAPAAGDYTVKLHIESPTDPVEHTAHIKVWEEDVAYSRYIDRVVEYHPAPGQFINKLPEYTPGDTEADMIRKATESISGTNDVLISLGNYGGYVTFAFDHTVVNVQGEYDFKISGNSFYAASNPNPDVTEPGGSAEPGIVMVAVDCNGNGIPDDPWYELAGSEYYNPTTLKGYSVTYLAPEDNHIPNPVNETITDATYIRWDDSYGTSGYVERNAYHRQSYWPQWIQESEMTFTGTRLPNNGIDESHQGNYYVLYCFPWGYVDNHPNNVGDLSKFKIDWAVDAWGNHVHLNGVDFIRVYTAVNQQCGWLGETSTEISRAEDLHIPDGTTPLPEI